MKIIILFIMAFILSVSCRSTEAQVRIDSKIEKHKDSLTCYVTITNNSSKTVFIPLSYWNINICNALDKKVAQRNGGNYNILRILSYSDSSFFSNQISVSYRCKDTLPMFSIVSPKDSISLKFQYISDRISNIDVSKYFPYTDIVYITDDEMSAIGKNCNKESLILSDNGVKFDLGSSLDTGYYLNYTAYLSGIVLPKNLYEEFCMLFSKRVSNWNSTE